MLSSSRLLSTLALLAGAFSFTAPSIAVEPSYVFKRATTGLVVSSAEQAQNIALTLAPAALPQAFEGV